MNITPLRTEVIVTELQQTHNAQWIAEYGEPGYTQPERGIVFANWNNISKRLQDYLEEAGFELEWEDEWYLDYDNGKAWRTSPDSYGWQCQVAFCDGFVLTPDDDITDWIEAFQDDPNRALPSRIEPTELEELGWERVDDRFENGFHSGQTDSPAEIYGRLIAEPDVQHVLFRLTDVGQFDVRFEAWVMREETEENE